MSRAETASPKESALVLRPELLEPLPLLREGRFERVCELGVVHRYDTEPRFEFAYLKLGPSQF